VLLDRKRINKWAKWVALFLAIVFALGFLVGGVGYGTGGFSLLGACASDNTASTEPQTVEEQIAAYQAALDQNPEDMTALLGLATIYQQYDNLESAAVFLEMALGVDPTQTDLYIRLANIYLNPALADYESAVTVLNKATSADPSNPDVYLKLGTAQNSLGHTEAAILAWERYLQLAPDGDMAAIVKEQVDKLSAAATTTTTTSSTTTTGATTTSTEQ